MIVIFSTRILRCLAPWFRDLSGLALFPFIILRSDFRGRPEADVVINHEKIHIRQQLELLLLPFLIWYFASFIAGLLRGRSWHEAYQNILFEREAYRNMYDPDYLEGRAVFSFLKYRNRGDTAGPGR